MFKLLSLLIAILFLTNSAFAARIEYSNGNVFEGDVIVKNGKKVRHGHGRLTFDDGSYYEGEFDDDSMSGKGIYKWASGAIYEGDFVDGSMHGFGTHRSVNGEVYTGEWIEDKKNGSGEVRYSDGSIYKGTWVDGVMIPVPQYGALAIDRSNGYFYGWAVGLDSQEAADARAVEECRRRGGKCTVVFSWSGVGTACFTSAPGNGSAFGWGLARSQVDAKAIADKECAKRNNGKNCSQFVWGQNPWHPARTPMEIHYDASPEILKSVYVKGVLWSAENLAVTRFRNGDEIPEARSRDDWYAYIKNEEPAFFRPLKGGRGLIYNFYATIDSRKIAPNGWKIPSIDEYKRLCPERSKSCSSSIRSESEWNGTNETKLNILPVSMIYIFAHSPNARFWEDDYGVAVYWTTSNVFENGDLFTWIYRIHSESAGALRYQVYTYGNSGAYLRLIKE